MSVLAMARAAAVAALYIVLTMFMPALTYGPLQFRIGEALTVLPIIFPETVVGITAGCLIANVFSPYMWYDMLFGTLATLAAALLTCLIGIKMKKKNIWIRGLAGAVPPIVLNALILPLMWFIIDADSSIFFINMGMIFLTQAGSVGAIGVPLLVSVEKINAKIGGNGSKTR